MGGEGTTMAMITSLKNNRNLLQKISPLERRSRYLKKLTIKSRMVEKASPQQLEAISKYIKADQRKESRTMIIVFSFIILGTISLLIFILF